MYPRLILLAFLIAAVSLFIAGCGGSSPGSSSSSLLGITQDPDTTALYKITATPGSLTVGTGKTVPMVVKLTDFSGAPVKESPIALNSSLEGTFTGDDKTDAGGFIYRTFTAGKTAGTTQISAMAFDAIATFSLQIQPVVAQSPAVTVFSALDVVAPDKTVFIQIFVADANGVPLDGAEVFLQSANGATFADNTGKTSDGWFNTNMTVGSTAGQETITAMAFGKTGTKTISVRN